MEMTYNRQNNFEKVEGLIHPISRITVKILIIKRERYLSKGTQIDHLNRTQSPEIDSHEYECFSKHLKAIRGGKKPKNYTASIKAIIKHL